jgi:exosortase
MNYWFQHMQSRTEELTRDGIVEVFATDVTASWHRLPNKLLFGVLMAAWILLFQFLGNSTLGYINTPSLFEWMWPANTAPDNSFESGPGLLLPFVVAGMFWWKRRELLQLPLRTWSPGIAIVCFSLLLHTLGYMVQQPRISIVGLFLGIYGLMGLAWGPRFLRGAFFPFVLFIFAIPLGSLGTVVTFPLRLLVTTLVHFIAHTILGMDIVRVGTGLFDASGTYQYDVAPACSGIRSLIAIFFLCTIYGYVTFRASWRWLVMISAALPLAVLGNMMRLLAIVVVADVFGSRAGDYVHENALFSMLPYVPAILGIILIARWLGRGSARTAQKESKP